MFQRKTVVINHYPLWKYVMLLLALIFGLLYALPNFYGEDPAIQITSIRSGFTNKLLLIQVCKILNRQNITNKSITLENNSIIIRLANSDLQLRAKEALMTSLDENYIIALNLAPATPAWLTKLGASPMRLGLDLCGGIHFLIEINMDSIFNKLQEQVADTLKNDLRNQGILLVGVRKIDNYNNELYFQNAEICNQAISWLKSRYRDLVIDRQGNDTLRVSMTDSRLHQIRKEVVQQNIIILRNRINQLGISEALVQQQGINRIVIELPGVQDTVHAKKILGATSTIEFRLINKTVSKTNAENGHVPDDSEVKFTRDGQPIVLYKRAILTGDHIINSNSSVDEYDQPQVSISLDASGSKIMSNFTKNNIGNMIATLFIEYKDTESKDSQGHIILVKQEEVINIATIQSRIGNNFRITGINSLNEARQLSLLLRTGTLIAPIQIVEERIIGPSLGLKNIKQGLEACLWSLVASILFMVLWYRKFGLIATIALITNLILIIGIMSLLPGATLTMPGIAGIILTLAIAVDASVLINERIKEELCNGYTIQQSIHRGYLGAFSSIIDANITTLITVIILYIFGTSSIKGFAITTGIGVVTSMFTAIIGTRAIVNLFYGGRYIDKLSI